MIKPKISIIIVNFNGKKYLEECFSSIKLAGKASREIIFVDNASSDGSVDFVKKNFSKTKIIRNSENLGFAEGNNVGLKQAKGEYILLLNNDTKVEVNFLDNFLKAFEEIPNLGCVQPKIVLMKDKNILDSCGSYLTDSSFLYHFGYDKNQALEMYNKSFPVFSVKGVAMLMRKDLIDKIGLFDDDFWCYYEETDFCNRVWMAGYECWYYPKVKIYHAAGGTSLIYFDNDYIQFQNFKNKLISFLKNYEIKTLLIKIPVYLLVNVFLGIFWIFSGKYKLFIALNKAILWNLKNFPSTMIKRKYSQILRKRFDKEIFKLVKINPRPSYYYYLFHGLKNYNDEEVKIEIK